MYIAIDSSTAVSWAMPDEVYLDVRAILTPSDPEQFFAPALFWYEVRNVLMINERRGRLNRQQTNQSLSLLSSLPILLDFKPVEETILRLVRQYALTVYDAAYLELALRQGALLATLDRRMAAVARTEGVGVFTQA